MLRKYNSLGRLRDLNFSRKCLSVFNGLKNDTKSEVFGIGYLGHFAEGSVLCRKENSLVHAVVTCKHVPPTGINFLPLTVDYRNRSSAHGIIPGASNRRDRNSSDDEILVGRIIDRAIRPLFPPLYSNEVQVVVTAHAVDKNVDPIVLAVNAASVALMVSKQPWNGPIACVRIGLINNELKVNPTSAEMKESKLNLLYAATNKRPLMIETLAHEIPEDILITAMRLAQSEVIRSIHLQNIAIEEYVSNKPMTTTSSGNSSNSNGTTDAAVMEEQKGTDSILPKLVLNSGDSNSSSNEQPHELLSSQAYQHIPDIILPVVNTHSIDTVSSADIIKDEDDINVTDELPPAAAALVLPSTPSDDLSMLLQISDRIGYQKAMEVFRLSNSSKSERGKAEGKLQTELQQAIAADPEAILYPPTLYNYAIGMTMKKAFRQVVLDGCRFDGRGLGELRLLSSTVDVLPETVHGSSFFQRGDTHVLSSTTLGSRNDAKLSNSLWTGEVENQNFLLHYDFPPYSTGSVGNSVSLNRRMIGHGNLAEKALIPVLPEQDVFPYTVRVYSECTSSNGSSSMASVCGATLSLLDAGVPIKSSVAGISIGLVSAAGATEDVENNAINPSEWVLISDINGSEDYYGDMDFKIAGSVNGVTAIQLDIKLPNGVPLPVLEAALFKAKEGRLQILEHMSTCLGTPRAALKPSAPRAELIAFDPERLRHLLGPGGEMIRYIRNEFDVTVDTDDDGHAYIFGRDREKVKNARILVQDLVMDIKQGDKYLAEVTEIRDFGAIVKVTRAQDALLHVSELSHDAKLIRKPLTEILKIGQRVEVQVIAVDKGSGTISVSRKKLLDTKTTVPDTLLTESSTITSDHDLSFAALPTFPVTPPKKFNIDFFRFKTAESVVVKTPENSDNNDNNNNNNNNNSTVNASTNISETNRDKNRTRHSRKTRNIKREMKEDTKRTITPEKAKAKYLTIKESGDKIWAPNVTLPKKSYQSPAKLTKKTMKESKKAPEDGLQKLELLIDSGSNSSQDNNSSVSIISELIDDSKPINQI